jgi:hypothetical protein
MDVIRKKSISGCSANNTKKSIKKANLWNVFMEKLLRKNYKSKAMSNEIFCKKNTVIGECSNEINGQCLYDGECESQIKEKAMTKNEEIMRKIEGSFNDYMNGEMKDDDEFLNAIHSAIKDHLRTERDELLIKLGLLDFELAGLDWHIGGIELEERRIDLEKENLLKQLQEQSNDKG